MTSLRYTTPGKAKPGFVLLPRAEISAVQHDDGRWMWAFSFVTHNGGQGFAPLPKWGHFAESETGALNAAAQALLYELSRRSWASSGEAKTLRDWAESFIAPEQMRLFA